MKQSRERRFQELAYTIPLSLSVALGVGGSFGCGGNGSGGPLAGAAGSAGGTGEDASTHGCNANAECDDNISCTIDSCLGGSCSHTIGPNSGSTSCPSGTYCTLEKGCAPPPACATVEDCLELWGSDACKANVRCEAASSLCLFDVLDKDKDGHPPQVCGGDDCDDSDPSRRPGLAETCDGKDNDCDGQVDLGATCSGLKVCVAGACVCSAEHACGAECVDKQSDPHNCGTCGNACVSGATCQSGICHCPTGSVLCSNVCAFVDSDWANCGTCGHACAYGATCQEGLCVCPQIESLCANACVDTQTSLTDCGTCGNVCPSGASCAAGQCVCPTGQSPCSGVCTNLSSDTSNCGSCGNPCVGGKGCEGGMCVCPAGLAECSGECADLGTNVSHCGACGFACQAGTICQTGVCEDPNCMAAQARTVKDVATGVVANNVAVEITGAIVTTPKILAFHGTQGSCMWAVFIRDPAEPYGLMVYSYGDDSQPWQPGSDAGVPGCPVGTDDIPDAIAPGDIVRVVGATKTYVPTGCTLPPSPQPQLQAGCALSRTGTGPAPAPVVVTDPSLLKAGAAQYRGLLVAVENVDAETYDGGSVGPYGVVTLAPSGLEVHDKFYFQAQGAPQFGPAQHFDRIVGVSHLDFCTWALQPLSKCTGFTPKSLDCP